MQRRSLLDLKIWCPWSGSTLEGKLLAPHKVNVVALGNNTLFSLCQICGTRIFTNNETRYASALKSASVLNVSEGHAKKPKEPKDDPSKQGVHAELFRRAAPRTRADKR
jgi:hypothetical protein